MSKIGKKKILVPKEVNISVKENNLEVKGPKGNANINVDTNLFDVKINEDRELSINPKKISDDIKKIWGMNRSLLNNAVIGVNEGYEKVLQMTGVGYRAAVKGESLNLQLGYSHDIDFDIPEGIKISVEKQTTLKITGSDKQLVGSVASKIKTFI